MLTGEKLANAKELHLPWGLYLVGLLVLALGISL